MTVELIEKFVEQTERKGKPVKIHFKTRNTITGIFIETKDYGELKAKNFWRIVTQQHITDWKKTGNINLAKIFSGSEFTKLTPDAN